MKRLKYILIGLFLLLPFSVKADTIYNVDMKINIDRNIDNIEATVIEEKKNTNRK